MADKLILCDKCGYFKAVFGFDKHTCPVCNNETIDISWDDCSFKRFALMSAKEQEEFAVNYVGHEFDPHWKDERIYYCSQRSNNINNNVQFSVKCHYCGSTNVEKITLMSKAIHNSIFGIWSLGRNTKEFHCNNCGADF